MKHSIMLGLALLAACGNVNQPTIDGGVDPGVDEIAPLVVSVSPADGAIGVRPDATIVVVFSEPMDRATVAPRSERARIRSADCRTPSDRSRHYT